MTATTDSTSLSESIRRHFRGTISDLTLSAASKVPAGDDLDLGQMAVAALNYLRGNPDPARHYECKFSLGPLGIPAQVPLLPPNKYGFDPIALGDTDCRMDWQYPQLRAMAGETQAGAVERGVRDRATVTLQRGNESVAPIWGGPANAYLIGRELHIGECLELRWAVPHFKQVFVPQSVPGREEPITVEWLGNTVLSVSPKGQYLPMFNNGKKI